MMKVPSLMHQPEATTQPVTVLLLVVVATALSNLEVGLVNVALPTLAATFAVAPTIIQWVAIAYQLAIIGTLILFGRLVDIKGGRVLYVAGMATMAVASALAALSQSALWLIFARGLLGLGAAMLLATGQALLALAYPSSGRGRAFGFMHMAVAAGLMAGPSVGGLLITTVGWRILFLAPLPLALVAGWWGWRVLPQAQTHQPEPLDLVGALLIFLVATLAVIGLTRLADAHWPTAIIPFLLMLLAGGAFLLVEQRQPVPLVAVGLLAHWPLAAGLLIAMLTFIALASNMFLIPFALQDLMGHSAAITGLVMMTVPLTILPIAPLAGSIADRWDNRLPTTVGLVAMSAAIFGMAQFRSTTALPLVVAILGLYGVGAGLFQAPNNSAVLRMAPTHRTGIVSGMLALARNLGQVLGVAIASMVWTWRQAYYRSEAEMEAQQALGAGLHDAFLVLSVFAVLALVMTAFRPQPERSIT